MKDLADLIEQQIDRYSLTVVLDALEEICHGKAIHLASNWQDTSSAKVWSQAASRLDRVRHYTSDHQI